MPPFNLLLWLAVFSEDVESAWWTGSHVPWSFPRGHQYCGSPYQTLHHRHSLTRRLCQNVVAEHHGGSVQVKTVLSDTCTICFTVLFNTDIIILHSHLFLFYVLLTVLSTILFILTQYLSLTEFSMFPIWGIDDFKFPELLDLG